MESSEIIIYLLKVTAIHGLFFLLYYLVLKNKTSYALNRAYLLSTLVITIAIPFMEVPVAMEQAVPYASEISVYSWAESDSEIAVTHKEPPKILQPETSVDYWFWIKWAYISLAVGLLLRSIFHLFILQKLKNQSVYVEKKWFRLFKTAQNHPFSFLSNVFIPKRIFGTDAYEQILEHECEHVRQHHSLDRLLIDFMVALLWFNPFIYLYRRALIEIHEYQADAAVLRRYPDPIGYQEVLFSQLSTTPYSGLVSHFNFSTIKKRIVMINKQTNKHSFWSYLLAVPVTLTVVLAFANRVPLENEPFFQQETVQGMKAGHATVVVTEAVEEAPTYENEAEIAKNEEVEKEALPAATVEPQTDYKPSILPLKETENMRLSSRFGQQYDPIDKQRKMHKGIDLATPIGTTVLATADGIVHESTYHEKYGNYIMLEHGEKYMTRYSQLSSMDVKPGDKVTKGQAIGLSGNSGRSTGPHLHYEVIEVGVGHKNPLSYINNHRFVFKEMVSPTEPKQEEEPQLIEVAPAGGAAEKAQVKIVQDETEVAFQAVDVPIEDAETFNRKLKEFQQLRDAGEVGADPQPLFVVDGELISRGGLYELDSESVAKIVVLKGASAKNKYGLEAENGVVEIETKKFEKLKLKEKSKEKKKEKPAGSEKTVQ